MSDAADPTEPSQSASPAGVDPFRLWIDAFVYAPLGVITILQKDLPDVIATGKARLESQLNVAKFIGKMAVRQAKGDLDRRLDEAERARQPAIEATASEQPDVAAATTSPTGSATSLPEAIIEMVAESPMLDVSARGDRAADLPIAGYESLAASQVVLRLGSLTPAELDAIKAYETTHRGRRTVLGKIQQLQGT